MSSRVAKKIRRQVRQTMREDYVSTLFWLKRLPFWQRVGVAWRIVKGVKGR